MGVEGMDAERKEIALDKGVKTRKTSKKQEKESSVAPKAKPILRERKPKQEKQEVVVIDSEDGKESKRQRQKKAEPSAKPRSSSRKAEVQRSAKIKEAPKLPAKVVEAKRQGRSTEDSEKQPIRKRKRGLTLEKETELPKAKRLATREASKEKKAGENAGVLLSQLQTDLTSR